MAPKKSSPKRSSPKKSSKKSSSKKSSPKKSSPKRSSPKKSSPKRSSPKKSSPKRSSPKKSSPKKSSPKRSSPKKSSPKKSSPKKSSPKKSSPKKSSPKRSSPKRSSPKKSSPKRSSPKRSSPKKSSPKKSSPKKSSPKKSSPKKSSPKKSSSKKSSSKKSSPKKSSPKKSSSKKSSSKKSSPKKSSPKKSSSKKSSPKKSSPKKSSPKKSSPKKSSSESSWKWWESENAEKNKDTKWVTLKHNGPVFTKKYKKLPKEIYLKYNGKKIELTIESEEIATFYASMLNTEYVTKTIFNKNFFSDWRKMMSNAERETIIDLKKCDFSKIANFLAEQNEIKKKLPKEEKEKQKLEQEKIKKKYGYCILNGHKQQIANYTLEPPGLFRGRGEHPKMGKIKFRVNPEDITINIGENEICEPPKGHKWEKIINDHNVIWLCSWIENIMGKRKYMMLNQSSALRGEKDFEKYELARRLDSHIKDIRTIYETDFRSKQMLIRQRAVAIYFIDKLSLRAGNEKDSEQADTVGVCTLRVEHIKLQPNRVVEFNFLGKDSIRYKNSIEVPKQVYTNMKFFIENKKPCDDLFDRLNTSLLNKYLQELMPGLTAKVFRTYNASITLEKELQKLTKSNMTDDEKIFSYNSANRDVAILCNHQKMAKASPVSLEKLKQSIKDQQNKIKSATSDEKKIKEQDKLKILKLKLKDKQENASVALGTSKLNYLDPRITVAWCKKFNIPISKVFSKIQQEKFKWAIETADKNFKFAGK